METPLRSLDLNRHSLSFVHDLSTGQNDWLTILIKYQRSPISLLLAVLSMDSDFRNPIFGYLIRIWRGYSIALKRNQSNSDLVIIVNFNLSQDPQPKTIAKESVFLRG